MTAGVEHFFWPSHLDDRSKQAIISLYNTVIQDETLLGYQKTISQEEGDSIVESLNNSLKKGEKHLFLAQINEEFVSMAILTPNVLPNCRHLVEISKGIIHPDHRGSGLLRRAFLNIAYYCRDLGMERLVLDVREGTRSHKIWCRLGFEQYGRLEDYAREGTNTFPGVYLQQSVLSLINNLAREF